MLLTSNEANKLLRSLKDSVLSLESVESKAKTFVASIEENIENARPDYSFEHTQKLLNDYNDKIVTIKHHLNMFNSETVLSDVNLTIDEALVTLPILAHRVKILCSMMTVLPKERVREYNSNTVSYSYTNYDISSVTAEYNKLNDLISSIQTNLDKANNTIKIDFPID